ncbi:MAG: hypothetical protein IIX11_05510, partial [Selenomonadales bacterium]|nr:hypothetical protein [Selenomonadales bacterium]
SSLFVKKHDPSIIFFRRDCVDFSCVTLRVAREKSPCRDKKSVLNGASDSPQQICCGEFHVFLLKARCDMLKGKENKKTETSAERLCFLYLL